LREANGLTAGRVLEAYRTVLRARALDDRRFVLNRAGKLAFIISPRGHEVDCAETRDPAAR